MGAHVLHATEGGKEVKYIIEAKGDKVLVEAEDRDHAFAKYFYDIINADVTLDKIGNIVVLKDGNEEYAFRTVPLLWKMGVIGTRNAIDNICEVTGVTRAEAKVMLKNAADNDARLVPLIDDLKLAEESDEDGLPDGMYRMMEGKK